MMDDYGNEVRIVAEHGPELFIRIDARRIAESLVTLRRDDDDEA